ncbi:hypothetical protein C9374_005964 [Naegleria lovaniensis]|uniref:Uncharacterized protein n=1 Tax=Naegleria lovaniensis TaxID=51637 RepID=A0AA88GK22_NAELO|nr:uncharacterized protein C9374_005964 [Naegleria lovaniensis]KAG2381580.1 hypothetical protein C9374_005964 [Naegleria lovaniensis]
MSSIQQASSLNDIIIANRNESMNNLNSVEDKSSMKDNTFRRTTTLATPSRSKMSPNHLSSSELNIGGRTSVFEQLITMPILSLIYQFVGRIKSFEQLRNIKLGLGALVIYYSGLLAFLLHRNNDRNLLSIYERYWNRNKEIIYSTIDNHEKRITSVTVESSPRSATAHPNILSPFRDMLQQFKSTLGLQ